MSRKIENVVVALAIAPLIVLTGTAAVVVYILYQWYAANPSPEVRRQRVQIYHDITMEIIRLNKEAVELDDEGNLQDSHERLVLNHESELGGPLDDVTQAYHGSYYIISTDVRDAIDEYIDYVTIYHETGFNLGRLLQLSGNVIKEMRDDLNLKNIFPSNAKDSKTVRDFNTDETI